MAIHTEKLGPELDEFYFLDPLLSYVETDTASYRVFGIAKEAAFFTKLRLYGVRLPDGSVARLKTERRKGRFYARRGELQRLLKLIEPHTHDARVEESYRGD